MPIAEAPPFLERVLYLEGAALVLGLLLFKVSVFALDVWLRTRR